MEGAIIAQRRSTSQIPAKQVDVVVKTANTEKLEDVIVDLREMFAAAESKAMTGHIGVEIHFDRGQAKSVKLPSILVKR